MSSGHADSAIVQDPSAEASREWGTIGKWRVPTVMARFLACPAPTGAESAGQQANLYCLHVPMGVQTSCDPGIYAFGRSLGVDPSDDPDPLWDFGHTGLQLWPSAFVLGDFLLSCAGRAMVGGRSVLELGCGVGLLGLVAKLAGARHVVLTDADPLVLSLCKHNLQLNHRISAGAADVEGTALATAPIDVRQLDWRDESALDGALPKGGVDVVLAADVVYEEGVSANLRRVLLQITDLHPRCQVLLAVKYRTDLDLVEVPTAPELEAEEGRHHRSVVTRWLGATCVADAGVGSVAIPTGGRDAPPREASRSPRRRGEGRSQLSVPAFEAELVRVWRRGPRTAECSDEATVEGLTELLGTGLRSGASWDETDTQVPRLEVWRMWRVPRCC